MEADVAGTNLIVEENNLKLLALILMESHDVKKFMNIFIDGSEGKLITFEDLC